MVKLFKQKQTGNIIFFNLKAVQHQFINITSILLDYNANPNIRDHNGKSALTLGKKEYMKKEHFKNIK
jgi:hypothetical protein